MPRPDLLALDEAALVMLGNRGLFKRATKDLDKGAGARLEELPDGTLVGEFEDGNTATLPVGASLKQAECTCGAARMCRHRIGTVLAYQADTGSEPGDSARQPLPPLDMTDEQLEERLGARVLTTAERLHGKGYSATVRMDRPPVVLLPTCTVTFLVPWDLAHARCDCVEGVDCEHIAMAVWALQAANPQEYGEQLVTLGDHAGPSDVGEVLAALRALQRELVEGGWSGALEGIQRRVAPIQRGLSRACLVWLEDLLENVTDALREHEQGTASVDTGAVAALLSELDMRCRACPSPALPRQLVHGEGSTGETKLDQVQLRGLGARYRVNGQVGTLSLFLRESGSDDALCLERRFLVDEGATPPAGPDVAARRLLGTNAGVIASGTITTRGARRRPNRLVDVSAQRLQTSVLRGTGRRLEAEADYAALAERLSARAPYTLSPRVRAWRVCVLRWGEVIEHGYDPGRQTVWGELADEHGARLHVASEWLPEAPAGPALLARALLQGAEFITGEAHLRGGQLWLEPLLIGFDSAPAAVDLHPPLELPELRKQIVPWPEHPVARHVSEARAWLAEVSRRGVAHLTAPQRQLGRELAERACAAGLLEMGTALQELTEAPNAERWNRACTRGVLLEHLLARQG